MPKIFIHYPEGAFSSASLAQMADEMTTAGLAAEGLPDTPYVRSNVWVYANEYPGERVFHGGRPAGTKVISVEVNVVGGALHDDSRRDMIAAFSAIVGRHAGIPATERVPVYVVIREVTPSNWGMFGKPITLEGLHHPPADAEPV